VLRHLVDLSEQQVAEQLGLSIGSVKTHLRRAKKRLRVELDPDDLGFSPA
jgi:DNA-directed RNA polymerase specialized sigma24 family protein